MNTTEEISKREIKYHDMLIKSDDLKKGILSILESDTDLTKLNLIHEDRYINGITADFALKKYLNLIIIMNKKTV